MKVRKVKQMLIAALVACAGILVSNAAAVASAEKEFALLPPVTLSNLSATSITYGQTLAASTISGTATTTDFGDVVGTFAWDSPGTVPSASDSQTTPYAVTFTPTDPNHSKTGATTLTLTVEINERRKAIEETFPAPTYAVTGPDEEGVYTVTLQDDVTGPVRIPDNLGKVQVDLNGHAITGPDGDAGGTTETGTSGQSAIIVYHDTEKSGDATELAIVDGNPDETADIVGGDGGDGNTPGDGAPAIKIDDGVQTGVTLVVGEQVDIQGGKGGNALGVDADGNGVPGGNGGAGVDGDVATNNGTITGGDGGAGSDGGGVGGNGGNGGDGVTGAEGEDGTGTTVGGNGGKGGNGDDKGGQGGDGGAGDPAGQKGAGGKTAAQKALEEAFKPNAYVEPVTNAEGQVTNYNVVVTNDITGPVVVPENVDKFVIDLNGKDITGADGTTGGDGIPGGDGFVAIVVSNAEAQVSVVGPGSITGGKGGNGNPPGSGAEALVDADGAKVDPVSVTGGATVGKGESGQQYVESAIQVVRVETTKPWGGLISVEYACERLHAGKTYKVTFLITVSGVEKAWTVEIPQQEFFRESYSNIAVINLCEKFGANWREPNAKIRAVIEPITE